MKKLLFLAAVGAAVGMVTKRACSTMCNVDWEQRIEAMPDNARPKWMFRNITAIRTNTDRILELLERAPAESAPPMVATG